MHMETRSGIAINCLCIVLMCCSIFLEGSDRFLLKAILVEKTFYISLYEHFDIINEKVRGHYVAKLMYVL